MLVTSLFGTLIFLAVGSCAIPVSDDVDGLELVAVAAEPQVVPVQVRPNPQKRSAYHVQESPGLRSHFSRSAAPFLIDDNAQIDGQGILARLRRSAEDGEARVESSVAEGETLPVAEAQVQVQGDSSPAAYFRTARSRLGAGDSSAAEHTPLRRVPRVNFVTQPRSSEEYPEHRDLRASATSVNAIYRRPPLPDPYMPQSSAGAYAGRLVPRGRFFDGYGGGYERYEPMEQARYDPYYYAQMRYPQAAYSPMAGGYYGERRFAYPAEMRYPYEQGGGLPNRRIIYYAHLPEVSRHAGYGGAYSAQDYYPYMDDYNYRYNRDMNQYGMPPMAQPAMSYAAQNGGGRAPERIDLNKDGGPKKNDESRTMSSSIRIKDGNGRYDTGSSKSGGAASSSDFTQPHYRME